MFIFGIMKVAFHSQLYLTQSKRYDYPPNNGKMTTNI